MNGVQGITEGDIADYLANTPGFFERHAELLSTIRLTSPHGQRAVSLQERQMEMLREKIRGLEMKIIEMIRNGQENTAIGDRLHRWTRALMLTHDAGALPEVMVGELKREFLIPQAGVRLWGVAAEYASRIYAQPVSEDVKTFTTSLMMPYCGINSGFEAAQWLDDRGSITSIAMIPLRTQVAEPAFGMLVLGSPDPTRYTADMATDFLVRIAELSSAALARLLPAAPPGKD